MSNDIVIQVENLGKKYTIGHQSTNGRYVALRDVLVQNARSVWNKTRDLVKGKPIILGDTMEEVWALKDVNLEVKRGETIGIIGRNGAGKSTLLKILSRITEPTEGRVTIKGRVASLLEVGTGFHPELTGRENIYLNGTILGMTRYEIKSKFDEIVDFSGVEKYIDTPVKRYSSGMQVRLAFAVAAHLEPEILIVDEVLAVGDAEFQKKCLGKMGDVAGHGRTVLFVSHNMGAIMQLCTSCVLLSGGMIDLNSATKKVIDKYQRNWTEAFVGAGGDGKSVWFKSVETWGENGPQSSFAHSEQIRLRMVIGIKKLFAFQNVGIAMVTRSKSRVFTANKALIDFADTLTQEIDVEFVIQNSLIAPMEYSFLVTLNTRTGTMTYDLHADICPIRVYDDGTDFAFAEGFDYGCIIVKDGWNLVRRSQVTSV